VRQVVTNGTFENTDVSMWAGFFDSTSSVTRSTTEKYLGAASLALVAAGAKTYIGANETLVGDANTNTIEDGSIITGVSWYIRSPATQTVTPKVGTADGAVDVAGSNVALTANTWAQLLVGAVTFNPGQWTAGSDEIIFRADVVGGGTWTGTVYYDEVYCYVADTPIVRGVGTVAANAAAISPGLPTGTAAGDLLIMLVETNNQAVTVAGWTEAPSSPQSDATDATRLTVFYKIAAGGDATTTSDSGDHQVGRILGIKAGTFDPVTPFNTSAGTTDTTSDTTGSTPTVTTTRDNCMIVACVCTGRDATGTAEFSSWTNANLVDIQERIDNTNTAGLGGGIGCATGIKLAKGATGTVDVTYATASRKGLITLAVNPKASLIWTPPMAVMAR
jgi:hypothetical protein